MAKANANSRLAFHAVVSAAGTPTSLPAAAQIVVVILPVRDADLLGLGLVDGVEHVRKQNRILPR